jgi:hypothetical protein
VFDFWDGYWLAIGAITGIVALSLAIYAITEILLWVVGVIGAKFE